MHEVYLINETRFDNYYLIMCSNIGIREDKWKLIYE